jgi:hypothetical protein
MVPLLDDQDVVSHDTTPADHKRWPKKKPHRVATVGFGVSNLQASIKLARGLEAVDNFSALVGLTQDFTAGDHDVSALAQVILDTISRTF